MKCQDDVLLFPKPGMVHSISHTGICSTPELHSLPKCVESTPPTLHTRTLNVGNFNQAHPVDELWSSREGAGDRGALVCKCRAALTVVLLTFYIPLSFGKVSTKKKNILLESPATNGFHFVLSLYWLLRTSTLQAVQALDGTDEESSRRSRKSSATQKKVHRRDSDNINWRALNWHRCWSSHLPSPEWRQSGLWSH